MRHVRTVVAIVVAALASSQAAAREPAPDPGAALRETVREWIVRAYRNELGVVPGTIRANALAYGKSGANVGGEYSFSIEGTPYDTKPSRPGVLQYFLADNDRIVDTVTLALPVPAYDVSAMAKTVVAAGKEVGLTLTADDEDPNTYWEVPEGKRTLWVALGRGVVVVEMDHPAPKDEKAASGERVETDSDR
jgi:hypothetical protein